jgi:tRNA modification GTPase
MAKVFSSEWSSDLAGGADTIAARSSAAGRAAVAVVRVSGPATREIAAAIVPELDLARPWRASLTTVRDASGAEIDRAIAVFFRQPRSYTGEDMLEISVHGAPWIVRTTMAAACDAGARPAGPGEFTRRAVANGKMDLVQAEAINDLVRAETAWQARLARAQADGVLSKQFRALRDVLVELLARLEGSLDFSDHEAESELAVIEGRLRDAVGRTRELLASAPAGRRVRDGLRVVIAGPPNSGKSTLFNRLVGRDGAIVSPHPGTTRDVIEAEIELSGVRVVLKDTAGVGVSSDPVEREGIRRATGAVAEADLVLLLTAADDDGGVVPPVPPDRPTIPIRSKSDLDPDGVPPDGWLPVSCRTGDGLSDLHRLLGSAVTEEVADLGGEWAISERHRRALESALAELDRVDLDRPELAVENVRAAAGEVGELTGEVLTEDVLDRIFGTFCIGK